jgi:hypothetical protein
MEKRVARTELLYLRPREVGQDGTVASYAHRRAPAVTAKRR